MGPTRFTSGQCCFMTERTHCRHDRLGPVHKLDCPCILVACPRRRAHVLFWHTNLAVSQQ